MGWFKKAIKKVVSASTLGIVGGNTIASITGQREKDRANAAQKSADQLRAEELEFAKEQRDYERAFLEEDRALSSEDYNRRLGIAGEMREAANFSPEFYDQQIGGATARVRSDVSKAGEVLQRDMSRMGVNPNSGRMAGIQAKMGLTGAALEADAANSTRMSLGSEERDRMDAARWADMSVSPSYVGRSVNDNVSGVIGAHAMDMSARAAAHRAQASSSRSGLMGAIGTIGGTILGGPIGGAIGGSLFGGGGGGIAQPSYQPYQPSQNPWGDSRLNLSY